ncbi:MAG: 23S rRNA (uracil(1939)-C(5))-methyltransferase RlmD [Kiritimatiellia bacterium]
MNPNPAGPPAPPHQAGDRIELLLSDLGEDDTCFGRLDSGIGVFVKGLAAPGDRVAARVKAVQKRLLHADLLDILQPGEPRIAPPCPHFGDCGGCKWQQIPYEEELRLKTRRVRDALAHIARIPDPPLQPILHGDEPYASRNKLQFDFTRAADGTLRPGFHRHGSFTEIVPLTTCLHASERLRRLFDSCRRFFATRSEPVYDAAAETGLLRRLTLRESAHEQRCLVDLATSAPENQLAAALAQHVKAGCPGIPVAVSQTIRPPNDPSKTVPFSGDPVLVESVAGFDFAVPPDGFFQVNTPMAGKLVAQALAYASPGPADLVLDLYCGVGLFSLPLARQVRKLAGFESHVGAIQSATENARRNRVANTVFFTSDLSRPDAVHAMTRMAGFTPTLVLLDPPRSGLSKPLLEWLCQTRPARLVYVSCNPGSLARDLGRLITRGGYALTSCTPADLFPRTNHVESVSLLVKQT